MLKITKFTNVKVNSLRQALAASAVLSELWNLPIKDYFLVNYNYYEHIRRDCYVGIESFDEDAGRVITCGPDLQPWETVISYKDFIRLGKVQSRDEKGRFV